LSQESTDAVLKTIVCENGRIDVVVHNAGHMVFGAAEAFTPDQLAQLYDTNVLSTQHVNRSTLPHFRAQGKGLVVWVSSSSKRGETPAYLTPYCAAKVRMDALAVSYASKLARWGIETSIIVPCAFTTGTKHFKNARSPNGKARTAEYDFGAHKGLDDQIQKGLAFSMPPDAYVTAVTESIIKVIDMSFGKRPFRIHIDPAQDGSEVVNAVADRIRAEFLRWIGLGDLLTPRVND
jgi:NAD(P)-dependent dehydrogenase (short-subunit alcohol dehydrogenase family)